MNKRILKLIFAKGISGASENAYLVLGQVLRKYAKDSNDKIKVKVLADVLDELSKKWGKEIDETISIE